MMVYAFGMLKLMQLYPMEEVGQSCNFLFLLIALDPKSVLEEGNQTIIPPPPPPLVTSTNTNSPSTPTQITQYQHPVVHPGFQRATAVGVISAHALNVASPRSAIIRQPTIHIG